MKGPLNCTLQVLGIHDALTASANFSTHEIETIISFFQKKTTERNWGHNKNAYLIRRGSKFVNAPGKLSIRNRLQKSQKRKHQVKL